MLVRLLYVSQPVGPVTTAVTSSLLSLSSRYNKQANISGVLCQGTGLYMQVLEGERTKVNQLFGKIMADKRHEHVELLSMEDITERQFGQWSMALVHLSKDDPMVKMGHPEFDPYAASSSDAMKLIQSLIKAGVPIDKADQ
jgi:hypothetical protein